MMGPGPQRKISYVLPLTKNAPAGHRLGVSGLTYNHQNHILYTGGRDGVIFAWQPGHRHEVDISERPSDAASKASCAAYHQAHTHWINGLSLAHNNEAVVSASSDTTVKLWRPFADDPSPPRTLGNHKDYVKAVATPDKNSDWVASGGLDHHVRLWDINEAREQLAIRTTEPGSMKGSVYALAATESLIASGGPENIVKLWDPRSGKRVNQLIGHTDNIRGLLLSRGQVPDTLISCSADRTIKIWSLTAARCMYSLSMHNDSVWSLYSDHPDLDVFYSGDRAGMIVKTDSRDKHDLDEGFSIGMLQEQEGINAIVAADDDVWAATANPSVHRWRDINKNARFQRLEDARNFQRSHPGRNKASVSSIAPTTTSSTNSSPEIIPLTCVLRLPEIPGGIADAIRSRLRQSTISRRRTSLVSIDNEIGAFSPLRSTPEESIEGQTGLIKALVLNDKRHVLTKDTEGEVVMWDVLQCQAIKSFGKQQIDAVFEEVNQASGVPQWFEADTNTGALTCTLDENHCFAAEVYADELKEFQGIDIKEDQRINLGAWVLRYLFDDFVLEELKRDERLRHRMNDPTLSESSSETNTGSHELAHDQSRTASSNLPLRPPDTPGLRIGLATPRSTQHSSTENNSTGAATASSKPGDDYFSARNAPNAEINEKDGGLKTPKPEDLASPGEPSTTASPTKDASKSFGQRLKGTFTPKKGKAPAAEEAVVSHAEDKGSDKDQSSTNTAVHDEVRTGSVGDVISEIRAYYRKQQEQQDGAKLTPLITPALPTEMPIIKPPANTSILIQEHDPTSGAIKSLFEGYTGRLGIQADRLEVAAPYWLGMLLLKNLQPPQEVSKISFLLQPHQQLLNNVTADAGNERLNANRLLRARKILGYVMDHLDPGTIPDAMTELKPEEALELYCQDRPVPPTMTLMNIRTHIWRSGGDVVLEYKPKWDVKAADG